MKKERIDLLVFKKGLLKSRRIAQRLILAGKVKINGISVTKIGTKIDINSRIEIEKGSEFVGKGGLKIQSAAKILKLDFKNKIVADIGASTGGFVDFSLKNGAKIVYAVDIGYGHLDWNLRKDERVVNMERTDIRDIQKFANKIDIFLIDVSFISLEKILPKIKEIIERQKHKSEIIALLKPQFEVGKEVADKFKGVIKDPKIQRKMVRKIKNFAERENFAIISSTKSKILGEKGNQEYFLYLRYPKKVLVFGTFDILHEGHKYFLEKASQFGDLIVIVPSDERVFAFKKRKPINYLSQRIKNLKKLGFKAVVEKENPWQNVLEEKGDIIVLGYDQNWESEIKKAIKNTNYLVKIVKIKESLNSHILKTEILRKD